MFVIRITLKSECLLGNKEKNQLIAIKALKNRTNIVEAENEIKILTKLQGGEGVPKLYDSDTRLYYYCMELLGPCLHDKYLNNQKILSESNFVIIAEQLLERIEFIHQRSIIHRDIKPHQLVLGGYKNLTVYLVDYGLSRQYESSSHSHIPYSEGTRFIGSLNYASVNTHLGFQQSRRDDLESYCYVLAYFYTGNLPWRVDKLSHNERAIRKIKLSTGPELFQNIVTLGTIFTYVKSLKFYQKPDYSYIKSLLQEFKKIFNITMNRLCWNYKRNSSVSKGRKPKKLKTKRDNKRNKSLAILSKVQVDFNDLSDTIVNLEYPEFKARKYMIKSKTFADVPTRGA